MIDCPLLHISDPAPTFESSNDVQLRPLEYDDENEQNIDVQSDTADSYLLSDADSVFRDFDLIFGDPGSLVEDTDSLFGDTHNEDDENIGSIP